MPCSWENTIQNTIFNLGPWEKTIWNTIFNLGPWENTIQNTIFNLGPWESQHYFLVQNTTFALPRTG